MAAGIVTSVASTTRMLRATREVDHLRDPLLDQRRDLRVLLGGHARVVVDETPDQDVTRGEGEHVALVTLHHVARLVAADAGVDDRESADLGDRPIFRVRRSEDYNHAPISCRGNMRLRNLPDSRPR